MPEDAAGKTARPAYIAPNIITYDEARLMEEVGPAVACARWDVIGSSSDDGSGWVTEENDDW